MKKISEEEIKECIKTIEEKINSCKTKNKIEELAIIILKATKNFMEKMIEEEENNNET